MALPKIRYNQKKFKETQLQPPLDEASKGEIAVFFVDAAPKVWGAFLGFLWSLTRIFIKSPSGRKRFNVLAALNAITHELVRNRHKINWRFIASEFFRGEHARAAPTT